jgi:hypothetical protein
VATASFVATATVYVARSTDTVADGARHRIVCVRTGTTLLISVDGVSLGKAACAWR